LSLGLSRVTTRANPYFDVEAVEHFLGFDDSFLVGSTLREVSGPKRP
jgi:hypothetical protein